VFDGLLASSEHAIDMEAASSAADTNVKFLL
jgi:hypothetical protein